MAEFNELEPRLKSIKNQFQLSAGLNLETLNTILSGTNHIWAASKIYTAAQILQIRPQDIIPFHILKWIIVEMIIIIIIEVLSFFFIFTIPVILTRSQINIWGKSEKGVPEYMIEQTNKPSPKQRTLLYIFKYVQLFVLMSEKLHIQKL